MRANAEAIEQAFGGSKVVFARVEACFGNAQFRLKMADGSEGRGTPLGKFTFATLRIAPGQVVICEPGKGVLTIIGRFDRHKDLNRLVKEKLIPRSFVTGDTEGACFEDAFEFEEETNEQTAEDKESEDRKVTALLKQYKSKKERHADPLAQARDLAEAEADARKQATAENEEINYEARGFKRARKAPLKKVKFSQPVADMDLYSTPEQTVDDEIEKEMERESQLSKRVIPTNWEDDIDIDAI
jgi:translation initiation factor IF-1